MNRIYGLTATDIENVPQLIYIVKSLPVRVTLRIVCDPGIPANFYEDACADLFQLCDLMLSPVDSSAMTKYNGHGYRKRFDSYLKILGAYCKYVEAGNEVNGDWLGSDVGEMVKAANEMIKAKELLSVITYFYSGDEPEQMAQWYSRNPLDPDIALVSIYPHSSSVSPCVDACFRYLQAMYPDKPKGIGEYGDQDGDGNRPETRDDELLLIKEFETYQPPPEVKQYIAGGFNWNAIGEWAEVKGCYEGVWKGTD